MFAPIQLTVTPHAILNDPDELVIELSKAVVDCILRSPLPRLLPVDRVRHGALGSQQLTKLRE